MRGHTTKHLLDTVSNDAYTFYLYSSGGVLHTVKVVCLNNGRTEWHSFHGAQNAKRWIELRVSLNQSFLELVKSNSLQQGSRQ